MPRASLSAIASSSSSSLTQLRQIDTATVLGAVNAVYFTGCALGAIGQSFLSDWLGRKKALGIAAILALVGSALVAGSVNVGMLIAVRIFQGGGLGMLLTLVPLYLSEVAPPETRGFLTGLTTFSFGMGYVMFVTYHDGPLCEWKADGISTASAGSLSGAIMPRISR